MRRRGVRQCGHYDTGLGLLESAGEQPVVEESGAGDVVRPELTVDLAEARRIDLHDRTVRFGQGSAPFTGHVNLVHPR